jgi:hypothetical protein
VAIGFGGCDGAAVAAGAELAVIGFAGSVGGACFAGCAGC